MIRYLLFDLDNTLYPESSPLGAELSRRINRYAADYLGVSEEEARRRRSGEARRYGTTMRWLVQEHGLDDIEAYMERVHPENVHDYIKKDPSLRHLLRSLPLPKSILTNSPESHARRVLRFLEIEDCFERVFDLAYSGFRGKPDRTTYESVLRVIGHGAAEVMFIDDVPSYLQGFRAIGGTAVLVDERGNKEIDDPEIPVIRSVAELPRLLNAFGEAGQAGKR